jgi:branched-chain amino acid transport system substrate-binding protein
MSLINRRDFSLSAAAMAAAAAAPGTVLAQAAPAVKVAFIDPLSGPFANIGQNQLKSFQFTAEHFNKRAGAAARFEMVPFDNKGSPQESITVLNAAIAQGIRYVVQGNGSGAALAIIDAINKHNERNPGKEVVFINYAAVDPALTNERCSFWHFRLDADTSQKMEALTTYMREQADVKNVYLINQNYSHGQQVSRYFKEIMARKKPEVKVVGDDLHPLGQVKDFAPFVAKIKASGADSIVTGNWGQDLTLLIKAAKDAGLNANFYTYYAVTGGVPTAMAAGVGGKVRVVAIGHNSVPGIQAMQNEFKQRFNDDWYTLQTHTAFALLSAGVAAAKSTDPVKVAAAMSGIKFRNFNNVEVEMRRADHQLLQPLYITEWRKADAKNPYSGKHRLQLPAGARDSVLRGGHADLVPDEASLIRPLGPTPRCRAPWRAA